ncbi:MAG: hemin uptake protein HemP [Rhodoferax sp.]|nr:hemin uptake protein HemP [Rhodoferax sp.]
MTTAVPPDPSLRSSPTLSSPVSPTPPSELPGDNLAREASSAVLSENLLRGQKSVAIQHNGSVYRLQATRLGKLILTK